MPTYDYLCPRCGPFEATRPMSEYSEPALCDGCGLRAPRAMVTAPALSGGARAEVAPVAARSHTGGCGCCRPKGARPTLVSQ